MAEDQPGTEEVPGVSVKGPGSGPWWGFSWPVKWTETPALKNCHKSSPDPGPGARGWRLWGGTHGGGGLHSRDRRLGPQGHGWRCWCPWEPQWDRKPLFLALGAN